MVNCIVLTYIYIGTNILVYTYISLITMSNKSVMTFISINKISDSLSVCLVLLYKPVFSESHVRM